MNGQPLRTDSVFLIASLSAHHRRGVWMLVDEGRSSWTIRSQTTSLNSAHPRTVRVLKRDRRRHPSHAAVRGALSTEFGEPQYERVPAERAMTVRCSTHTSGIQIFGVDNGFPQNKPGDTLATTFRSWLSCPGISAVHAGPIAIASASMCSDESSRWPPVNPSGSS
jgi:hypothetical protein